MVNMTHYCFSTTALSIFILLTIYVAQQYKGNLLLRFHGNNGYTSKAQRYGALLILTGEFAVLEVGKADPLLFVASKGKGKGRLWVLQHCCLLRHIVRLPERVPSFISRGAAHTKRRVRPLLAKEGTIPGI
jgi:hypothetical protein